MFMGKEVRVFLKGQAKEAYLRLKGRGDKEAAALLSSFERVKELLKENPQYGDPIRKALIPKRFLEMGIKNLYRVELANYWRLLYTLEGTHVEILLFVLAMTDHKEYDRLFGYRKR